LTIEEVELRQTLDFFGRHVEGCVFHSKRIEETMR
jgi:hypothetical protein